MLYLANLKSANPRSMSFKQIIDTYNNNFELLKDYLITLRDKYLIETFTGSTEQTIVLENKYSLANNNIFVYINGVLQLLDRDYHYIDNNSIELVSDRDITDEIRVIIMQTSTLQSDLAEDMHKLHNEVLASLELANSLLASANAANDEIQANVWAQKVLMNKITINQVPEDFRSKVSEILKD